MLRRSGHSKKISTSKKSTHRRAPLLVRPGGQSTEHATKPSHQADCHRGSSLRKWKVLTKRAAVKAKPGVTAFIGILAAVDLTSPEVHSQLSIMRTLLKKGEDGADSFGDHSLVAVVQRCARIDAGDMCVSFVYIMQYVQLACKTSRWLTKLLIST